jgi:hypothetical protein
MKRYAAALCVLLMGSAACFAGETVGLDVNDVAGFVFKPGGSAQWFASAPADHQATYEQPTYSQLTGETQGHWQDTWSDTQGNKAAYDGIGHAMSRAYFGSLGVYAYAWVSDKNAAPDNYWDWSANATGRAAFNDLWRLDAPGVTAGTPGTLTVTVVLEGSRTSNRDRFNSSLSLALYNYTTASSVSFGPDITAGTYELTLPFVYGQNNGVTMSLTGGAGAFNQFGGGESFVDFYSTATITGMTFRDSANNIIANGTLTAGSAYAYPAPEPATLSLLALGGLAMLRRRRTA